MRVSDWTEAADPAGVSVLGRTRDDAAGEALDKAAALLGLSYPGGPAIEAAAARAARAGTKAEPFPVPMAEAEDLSFSFSGLKTALRYRLRDLGGAPDEAERDALAAAFQEAVVASLADRVARALHCLAAAGDPAAERFLLSGGVAANRALRARLSALCAARGVRFLAVPIRYATDNAAMVGVCAWTLLARGAAEDLAANADAAWELPGVIRVLLFTMAGAGPPLVSALREAARGRWEIAALVLPRSPTAEDLLFAEASGLPWTAPDDLSGPDFASFLAKHPYDLLLVSTYDRRIPVALAERAGRGGFNLHPSLLPAYRGHNPYFWVLRNGERETGVTLHRLADALDAGPVVCARRVPIHPRETLGSLYRKLSEEAARLGVWLLEALAEGAPLPETPQDESAARAAPRAPRVRDEDLRLSGTLSCAEADRLVRAANPFYGARLPLGEETLFVWEVAPGNDRTAPPPGEVRTIRTPAGPRIVFGCRDGGVILTVVEVKGLRIGTGAALVEYLSGAAGVNEERTLSQDDLARLHRAAADAIVARGLGRPLPPPPRGGVFDRPRGVFATLREGEALRGCIGIVEPRYPLGEAAVRAACDAAYGDPRFPPLAPAEFPAVTLKVSVLSPLRPARPEEVVPGRHGVVLEYGARRALYLPEVASEIGAETPEALLAHLARFKAGLSPDAWRDRGGPDLRLHDRRPRGAASSRVNGVLLGIGLYIAFQARSGASRLPEDPERGTTTSSPAGGSGRSSPPFRSSPPGSAPRPAWARRARFTATAFPARRAILSGTRSASFSWAFSSPVPFTASGSRRSPTSSGRAFRRASSGSPPSF
ncbi:MAG: hypothetical protein KatS3mg014_2677 [Actinomycetota bacterium]|nr:MAG: hypothetical protein KatS3mg014_2677 [Actinomycetota bacterium]